MEARAPDRAPRGLALAALATLLFTVMGVAARKAAGEGVGWAEVGAARAGIGALVALAAGLSTGARLRSGHPGLSWARSAFGTGAALCTFYTLSATGVALGDVVTLHATAPLFLALLSPRLLGERPSPALWILLMTSFGGVALVVGAGVAGPRGAGAPDAAVAAVSLLAALFSALAMVMVRRLRSVEQPDSPEGIALHFSLVSFGAFVALAAPSAAVPTAAGAAWMLAAGVSAGLAQLAMTRAYTYAEAARVGGVSYLGVLLTHGAGIALLGEAPRASQLAGAALVVAAGAALAWDAARAVRLARGPAALACALAPATADAGPPCDGCVLEGDATRARPLLVVLHGDEGSPGRVAQAWRETARARGFVLFAPKCPRALGCRGSYWQWGRDPAWLFALVDRIAAEQPIDPGRRWLAGWSGGATYMGMFADRWPARFAALSFAGGGVPQSERRCASPGPTAERPCAPVHYLAGDRNPLFELARATQAHLASCGHAVTWDLRKGVDHEGEWRAYAKAMGDIAAFLERAAAPCAAAPPPAPAPGREQGSAPPASSAPAAALPREAPPARGCGCGVPRPGSAGWLAGAALVAALARGRPRLQGRGRGATVPAR